MKSPHSSRGGRMLAGSLVCALVATAFGNEPVPRGTLAVDRDLVRVGARSQLDWQIEYPSSVDEIVDIDPKGTIRPKKKVRLRARVLGISFQTQSFGSYVNLPVEIYWSRSGGGWKRIFSGTQDDVKPATLIIDTDVAAQESLNFGARGHLNSWLPLYYSGSSTKNVKVLKNGDTPPSYTPAFNQGTINSFLRPYLGADGRVKIGDRDLLVLWELYATSTSSPYFDLQDVVLLVTFD